MRFDEFLTQLEEAMHSMTMEQIGEIERRAAEYRRKWYGFDRESRGKRTDEWVTRASARLHGKTSTCCECGEDYPAVEHHFGDHVFCDKCRPSWEK